MKNFIKSFLLCAILVVSFPQYSNAGGIFTSEEDREAKRTPRRARVQQVYNPLAPYVRSNYGLVRFLGVSLYCMIHPVCYVVDWVTRPALQSAPNNTPTEQQPLQKKKKKQDEQDEKDIPNTNVDFQETANGSNGKNPNAGPETQNRGQERGGALTTTVETIPPREQIETQKEEKDIKLIPTEVYPREQTGSAKTSPSKGNSTDNVTLTDEIVIVPTSSTLDRNMKRRIKDEEEKENRGGQPNIIHNNSPKDLSAPTNSVLSGTTFDGSLDKCSFYSPKKFRPSPSNHRPSVVMNLSTHSTKENPTPTPEKERRGENYIGEMLNERKSLLDAFSSMGGEEETTDDNSEDSTSSTD